MSQGDPFGKLADKVTDPIVGLHVRLPALCTCKKKCDTALIVGGEWPTMKRKTRRTP